jgi:hypothetical protein
MAQFKSPTGSHHLRNTRDRHRGRPRIVNRPEDRSTRATPTSSEVNRRPVEQGDKVIFVDTVGDEWTFDQLVPEDEETEEE